PRRHRARVGQVEGDPTRREAEMTRQWSGVAAPMHKQRNRACLKSLFFKEFQCPLVCLSEFAMLLLNRRVPLYVSLPVVASCGVGGVGASTGRPAATPDPPARPDQIAGASNTAPSEPRLAPAAGTLPIVALPIEEIDLPTPALPATKLEPLKTDPDDNVRS